MTDPTGIGAAILGLIGTAYWGGALLCLVLALWIPKSRTTKLMASIAVVALFLALPTKHVVETQSQAKAVDTACSRSNLAFEEMTSVPGFYASPDALLLVWGPEGKEQLKPSPGLLDVATYMLERRMSFLEMDMPSSGAHLHYELAKTDLDGRQRYLRLSIEKAGSPTCAPSEAWALDYRSQKLPEIRRRGLLANYCLALEGVETLRSRYRAAAKVTPTVLVQGTQYGMWEHALEIRDESASMTVATFPLFITRDNYGNRSIACGKVEDARRFAHLVPIVPDERIVKPMVVTNEDPIPFPVTTNATSQDISAISTIPGLDKVNSTNNIADDGMVWFEPNYKPDDLRGSFSLRGYFLVVASDGRLHRTLIRANDFRVDWITGLQVTSGHIRFVARSRADAASTLLEYSRKGEPKRALLLTPEQVARLK